MGLIKAAKDAVSSMLADQWREYFYCDALSNDILVAKGRRRPGGGRNTNKGGDNIISNGSIIAVNEGQCMMIVEQNSVRRPENLSTTIPRNPACSMGIWGRI